MKNKKYIFIGILGLLLMVLGGYALKEFPYLSMLEIIAYLTIGIGCGIFGIGVGGNIKEILLSKDPEGAKKLWVEEHDERNLTIVREAKARGFSLMVYLYGGMILAFGLMKIEFKYFLVVAIFYLIVNIYTVALSIKLRKKM